MSESFSEVWDKTMSDHWTEAACGLACGLGKDHVGECGDCSTRKPLGWAHLCLDCWEAHCRSANGESPVVP